ncbi:hypothetical protein RSAG8_10544, partial [Rhizoctonia solani AG-8 WAC10335]
MPRHSSSTAVDPAVAEQLKVFHDGVSKRAEDIVFKTFPQKILTINQKIEQCSGGDSPLHSSGTESTTDATVHPPPAESEPPTKKRRHENGDSVVVGAATEAAEGGPRFSIRTGSKMAIILAYKSKRRSSMNFIAPKTLVTICVMPSPSRITSTEQRYAPRS